MRRTITAILMILSVAFCCTISRSCANTQTPPSGGPKDTIPPVLTKIVPEMNKTEFPLTKGTIKLSFNEYTVVKTASEIFLSPPTRRDPVAKVKGMDIIVSFRDSLLPNTTYTLDFGTGLADNNEGNIFPRMVYTFSTGSEIDSMYITGTVLDCQKLTPVKGILVGLYTNPQDSACILEMPLAASRTDDYGWFCIRNVKPQPYYIYAFSDENKDKKYTLGLESVAFLDSVITPVNVVRDSIYELGSFNMKDTLSCEARESQYTLSLFKEYMTRQYVKNKGRIDEKTGFVTFSAPNAEVESFSILGVDSSELILQYTPQKDSVTFWINTNSLLPDSLMISLKYMKTDSTGTMVMTDEDLAVAMSAAEMKKRASSGYRDSLKNDTIAPLKLSFTNSTVEQEGISFIFDSPLTANLAESKLIFTSTNPKNQIDTLNFTFERDSVEICKYHFTSAVPYQVGYKYKLTVPEKTFTDLYGRGNKQEEANLQLPNDDKLGSIRLNLHNVNSRYIIELVNPNKSKVFRKFIVTEDCQLYFPYIQAGDYTFRITEDKNGNGLFDTGNLLLKKQPEKVMTFKLPSGAEIISLPEQTDLEQDLWL
ncbi:MAG: Ig-like domain-containing protein [Bacteroidales bacterium]|nr:Ig-like domain-containing protein [Bacteroidales bacterium]